LRFRRRFDERRSVGKSQGELPAGDLLIVFFVSADDALHEAVTDDVAFIEIDEADSLDAFEDLSGLA